LALRKVFRQLPASNTSIVEDDAYHSLRAYLPPKEKRGLVLMDAAFEEPDEFQRLDAALRFVNERWATGVYCVWYPLKAGGVVNTFYSAIKRSGLSKLLLLELWVKPLDAPLGLNGSGMLIMNPPWQLDVQMREAYNELLPLLAPEGHGGLRVQWLTGE
jgi:23S rRNA (adenine2030-N6)-methyltransferase